MIPDVEDSSCSVVPAWIATNDGGATPLIKTNINKGLYKGLILPKNVPMKNGFNGTSTMGDVMLMNQFGKNGVMRRKIM